MHVQPGNPRPCRFEHIIDHQPDLVADQFGQQPVPRHVRKAVTNHLPAIGDKGQFEQLIQRQQPGAHAVVNIMIVIGNIIGNRRYLRFQRRPAVQIEIQRLICLRQRPGRLLHRSVMLGEPLQHLPCQIETVPARIGLLQQGQSADGLGIVVKAAMIGQCLFQRILAGMAERRMTNIMGKRAADLRHLEAVRQPDAVMIAVGRNEDLGLVAQAAKGNRVDDAVTIALEIVARPPRDIPLFIMQPPPALCRVAGIALQGVHLVSSLTSTPSALAQAKPSPPPLR